MKEKELQNGLEDIRKIRMTSEEKKHILQNVLSSHSVSKQPVLSPWTFFSFTSSFQKNFVYYGVLPILFVFVISGGAVFASQSSLPGDIFYPIKVNLVEPIRVALISSPKEKVVFQASLATERLIEAETLAVNGKLDKSKEEQLNKILEKNTAVFNTAVSNLRNVDSSENVDNIVTSFQANMNAHAQVLDLINSDKNARKQNEDIKITKTARDNAGKIRDSFKNSNGNDQARYMKKKEQIQSLINTTTTQVLNQPVDNSSSVGQTIISDTSKTLDQAQQSLNDADNKNKNGDSKDAYSSLLDSETSAKQADIFFKSGLKFKGEDNKKQEREDN